MKFKNRRAQYPGRVKLVPVAGSDNLYDLTPEEGSVTGSYEEGTPLNADTFNALQEELNAAIENAKLNSIKITDGTNSGDTLTIGNSKNIALKLPSTIKATLNGKATSAESAEKFSSSYGGVITKTVYISNSYVTVYTANTHATIVLLLAPWSGGAKNTAVFAASYYSDSEKSINDVNYKNVEGHIDKQWNGKNFQIKMTDPDAGGQYALTIIDAHY